MKRMPLGVQAAYSTTLTVSTYAQTASQALGLRGVMLSLQPSSTLPPSSWLQVSVNYSAFARAFGADFGDRLRLVAMPACSVTTPSDPACRKQAPPPSATNTTATDRVSSTVDLGSPAFPNSSPGMGVDAGINAGAQIVLAVVAGTSSGTGDWSAFPLAQNSDWAATPYADDNGWSAGSVAGDFTYKVPVDVPPAPGGLEPEVALTYSSARVDGLTSSKNTQASWAGEGWDYHPGFVQRDYRLCRYDGISYTGGDLCWMAVSPLTLSLNGKTTRIVAADTGWKAEDDSAGWKVERLTGVDNGVREGEAFKVTTRDGTQYFFGSRRAGGPNNGGDPNGRYGGPLVVQVFGNNVGEPCYNASGFAASSCQMPYRWNLDKIVDVHDNVIEYQWYRDRASYGGNNGVTVYQYDHGSRLVAALYGANQVAGSVHTGRVQFDALNRCLGADAVCNSSVPANWVNWPDTPWDQFCAVSATTCAQVTPVFFTPYRLSAIETQVYQPGSGTFGMVNRWEFGYTFPAHSDGTSPSLWLDSVIRPGFVNPMYTGGTDMANRVDYGAGKPEMKHYRLTQIDNGTGAMTQVTYSGHDCTASTLPTEVDFNPKRCYAQNINGLLSWWHKYVVTDVDVIDHVAGGQSERWHYDYSTIGSSTTTMWKHDQAWHTPTPWRTWSRWAGYPMVITTRSDYDGTGPKEVTETLYYRGLHGDWTKASGAGTRQVNVIDDVNSSRQDKDSLTGRTARVRVFDGPINADRSNWVSAQWHVYGVALTGTLNMASPNPPVFTVRVREAETRRVTTMSGGVRSETRVFTDYEGTYGLPIKVINEGDTAVTADNTCTHTEYATANTTKWLIGLKKQEWVTNCAATLTAASVLKASRTHYDGMAYGAEPTRGLVTLEQVADEVTAYPLVAGDFQQRGRSTFDTYGRIRESYDALDRQVSTAYTPATGGPVTKLTVTGPSANGQRWDTAINLDVRNGRPTAVIDVNGKVILASYNGQGRLTKMWQNNRANGGTTGVVPDLEYIYNLGAPATVTTKTLMPNGAQLQSFEIFDGLLRPRQKQTLSATTGGSKIEDTVYNGIGRVEKTTMVYGAEDPSGILRGVNDRDAKKQTRYVYDNMGRVTNEQEWAGDGTTASQLWQTVTDYDGEKKVTVTPPSGGTATTTIKDVHGLVTELRQHSGGTPAGPVVATTTYGYDRLGQLTQVKDTANNTWTYTYDLLGRRTRTVDPDAGTSTITYDAAGQVLSTVDGRGESLHYTYDGLGRTTHLREDSPTGNLRASWTYDGAARGKLVSATRYEGGQSYIQTITGYDDGYRPLSTTYTVPGFGAGGATLTYTTNYNYNINGDLNTQTFPGVGGLPQETVTKTYNSITGLPKGLTTNAAQGIYLDNTIYFFDGLAYNRFLGGAGMHVRVQANYAAPGRRLSSIYLNTETPGVPGDYGNSRLANDQYLYDSAGKVTSIRSTTNAVPEQQECFRYDSLQRLNEAWSQVPGACTTPQRGGPDPYWRQWSRDALGNRLSETDKDPSGDTTWTDTVGAAGAVAPHQVKTITGVGPKAGPTRTFSYDAAGNTTSRTTPNGVAQTITWDAEGRLGTVTQGGVTTTYIYDTNGKRLIASSPNKKILYLPDGTELVKTGTANPTGTRYYEGIAVRDSAGLRWIFADHNGTAIAQIDPSSLAIMRQRSMPYGQVRGPVATGWKGARGYTGGIADDSGLIHLGEREYDPTTGRFISVDPLRDLTDPAQWNGYSLNPLDTDDILSRVEFSSVR
ncbi:RHS repeat domain-containing protein [Allorhizocola rhizosphaerae]|uniref:RHS repeat domain-containing protein n=1 Tax=Allorhizocola rhizosphaerae TaxID=1872709 RepID=UPI0013C35B16|nr:RHS repeat protein [Allorhizocola rhizosphaerae]